MKLDLQLTTQTKILIGILVTVLIVAIATQLGPGLFGMLSNTDREFKRQTLSNSKDLVAASKKVLPIETVLYQRTGLADQGETTSIFDDNFPDTIIRGKIDSMVRSAGIPQNYQLNIEPIPGKKSEKITLQARRNLILSLYQEKLKTEMNALNAEIEAENYIPDAEEVEVDMMGMFMDAWLDDSDDEEDKSDKPEEGQSDSDISDDSEDIQKVETEEEQSASDISDDSEDIQKVETEEEQSASDISDDSEDIQKVETEEEQSDSDISDDSEDIQKVETEKVQDNSDENSASTDKSTIISDEWEFASMPEAIPNSIRIELIEHVISIIDRQLVGAESTLFENEFYETQTEINSGFFGLGAKKPTIEVNFNPKSQILAKFEDLFENYDNDSDKSNLTLTLLEYLVGIQTQIDGLTKKLVLAPTSYSPESYTIKMKFKAEIDKLVNLNRIIETTTKWLIVRDLQISTDNKQDKITVDMLLIARVYQ